MSKISLHLRLSVEQKQLIDQAARILGQNRSEFVLEAACEKAKSVLMNQTFFSLDTDRFQQFTALLDAPISPNQGLTRLMAIKAPWDD